MNNEHLKVVVASGGFDPLHSGHIEYLKESRFLGNRLIVALASDYALIQKKKNFFLGWEDRKSIIKSLKFVDDVIIIDDYYNHYEHALMQLRKVYPTVTITFASGNGPTQYNTPSLTDQNVEFIYNVGGDRINSSRSILRNYANYITNLNSLEESPARKFQ